MKSAPLPALVRFTRWVLPAVVVVELVLMATGVLDLGDGLLLALSVEGLLAVVVLMELAALRAAFKRARREGADRMSAFAAGLETVLPPVLAPWVKHDYVLTCAFWFAIRLRRDVSEDGTAIPYGQGLRVIMLAFLVVDGVVAVVLHLAMPWPVVRNALVIAGIAGLIWLAGFLCALSVYPHSIDPRWLRLRFASFHDIRIPAGLIESVGVNRRHRGLSRSAQIVDGSLVMETSGETNVVARLREPHDVRVRRLEPRPVRSVEFYADDPASAVAEIRALLHLDEPGRSPR